MWRNVEILLTPMLPVSILAPSLGVISSPVRRSGLKTYILASTQHETSQNYAALVIRQSIRQSLKRSCRSCRPLSRRWSMPPSRDRGHFPHQARLGNSSERLQRTQQSEMLEFAHGWPSLYVERIRSDRRVHLTACANAPILSDCYNLHPQLPRLASYSPRRCVGRTWR